MTTTQNTQTAAPTTPAAECYACAWDLRSHQHTCTREVTA